MHLFFIPAVFLGSQFHMVNTAGQDVNGYIESDIWSNLQNSLLLVLYHSCILSKTPPIISNILNVLYFVFWMHILHTILVISKTNSLNYLIILFLFYHITLVHLNTW